MRIIRIDMSVYFGSQDYIQQRLHQLVEEEQVRHILIVGTGINFIDLSGSEMLAAEANRLQCLGGGIYFSELQPSVYESIVKSGLVSKIGNQYFFDKKKNALNAIYRRLNHNLCTECDTPIFRECRSIS